MGYHLGNLARLHAAIEREVEIERHLDGLVARDQGCDRNDASVSRRQAGTLPDIAKKRALRVFLQGRRDHPHIVQHFLALRLRRRWSHQSKCSDGCSKKFHPDLLTFIGVHIGEATMLPR